MTMFQTLGKVMRYHDRLKVKCACGHEASFSQQEAYALFSPDSYPSDIRQRLRCSACKAVGKVEIEVG